MNNILLMKCYALEKATWLNKEGFNKGLLHDRQELDFILPAETILRVRQPDISNGSATLRLLCNDSAVEKTLTLKTEWQEISATVDTVPFIDTLYMENVSDYDVEFETPEKFQTLPFFDKNSDSALFFSSWLETNAPYALIDTGSAKLLVPFADMDNLQNVNTDNGIYGLLDYYEKIFAFYNDLAGLSFTPVNSLNQNIANKYFIKADKNGVGSAYFNTYWCAETSSTIAQGWIDNVENQWTVLHEIAHGYQGNFMNDSRFSAGEVWNNIYGAWFQQVMLGNKNELYTDGWLYNDGNRGYTEDNFRNNIYNQTPVNQWNPHQRLLLLMLMQFKSSMKNFVLFNDSYRALANSENFSASDHHILDMLAEASASAAGYDMTPYIDLCGVELDDITRERIQTLETKPVYPLFDLLPEAEWDNAQQAMGLQTSVWLVDNAELSVLNKKGNVTFDIIIDNLAQIYGRDLKIIDHCGNDITVRITNTTLEQQYLPIGVYQLILPKGKSQKYTTDQNWFVVREGENNVTINYTPLNDTSGRNEELIFLGLGDAKFATLTVENESKTIQLNVTSSAPHSYYGSDIYASVTIFSATGEEIFNRDMPGQNCPITYDEIPFEDGYLIEVYHAECGKRLYSLPNYLDLVVHNEKINNFRIDKTGLFNTALNNDPDEDLRSIIAESAEKLRVESLIYTLPESAEKISIWLMINKFTGEERDLLLLEYADVIPLDNSEPDILTGSIIHLELRGLGDAEFSEVTIDNSNYLMTVNTKSVIPHNYYPETYAWIRVWNENGIEMYNRNYDGSIRYPTTTENIPLRNGYVIDILHYEPFRCVASNVMQNTDFQLAQDNTWEVISSGLQDYQHPTSSDPKATIRGNKFLWKLLGYYDVQFASIDMDLVNNQVVYSTEATTPHSIYGEDLYAEVNIIDNNGFLVYHQEIQSKVLLEKYTNTMTLEKGYTIEVYHAEAYKRSVILNTETEQKYPQKKKVVYQVIEKGLLLISEE
ncbi:putative mucin/carbohydrate-binding domain-containing protein [Citrobacter sp. Igbk 14]|uniref:putative mucin/carbohydrate-binding domain-containing protein n=1 Tax=Citrobacter sp. Igbk 14 TaxID=2963960 RepID=UPI0023033599|nr:putative mucin/carbohydrate-binding domain-containing protein [Citrobacter sp. Igbk 14]MDA8513838.1 M60 family metallopeptidase [Citrobacter sp. Igbk 14]